jgi:hypothetical protein
VACRQFGGLALLRSIFEYPVSTWRALWGRATISDYQTDRFLTSRKLYQALPSDWVPRLCPTRKVAAIGFCATGRAAKSRGQLHSEHIPPYRCQRPERGQGRLLLLPRRSRFNCG